MNFKMTDSFSKEFERLKRKFLSLSQDLEELKEILQLRPEGFGQNFTVLHRSDRAIIVKNRLLCRYLRRRSLRIVYAYQKQQITFVFIDIYSKSDREREDQQLIRDFLTRASS